MSRCVAAGVEVEPEGWGIPIEYMLPEWDFYNKKIEGNILSGRLLILRWGVVSGNGIKALSREGCPKRGRVCTDSPLPHGGAGTGLSAPLPPRTQPGPTERTPLRCETLARPLPWGKPDWLFESSEQPRSKNKKGRKKEPGWTDGNLNSVFVLVATPPLPRALISSSEEEFWGQGQPARIPR